jgi:hypothetical protein
VPLGRSDEVCFVNWCKMSFASIRVHSWFRVHSRSLFRSPCRSVISYIHSNEIFVQDTLASVGFGCRFLCGRNSKRGYGASESRFDLVSEGRRIIPLAICLRLSPSLTPLPARYLIHPLYARRDLTALRSFPAPLFLSLRILWWRHVVESRLFLL